MLGNSLFRRYRLGLVPGCDARRAGAPTSVASPSPFVLRPHDRRERSLAHEANQKCEADMKYLEGRVIEQKKNI